MESSRVLGGGGGGGGGSGSGGGSLRPFWSLNWGRAELRADLVDYGSSTTTPGTSFSTPSTYTNNTSSTRSSRGLDALLDLSCLDDADPTPGREEAHQVPLGHGDSSALDIYRLLFDNNDAPATSFLRFAVSRSRDLAEIAGSVRNTFLTDMFSVVEEQEGASVHVHVQSARFAQTSILKMLSFVDVIVRVAGGDGPPMQPADKLRPLMAVREALSAASQDIRLCSCSTPSAEAKRITDEMASLLLLKQSKLEDAIWNTMEETRSRLRDNCSWWGAQTAAARQGSPAIHKVTRAIVSYINLLTSTDGAAVAHQVADEAAKLRGYVPRIGTVSPLASLIMETVSCLEEKLAGMSRSFSDHSLMFLFLINNSRFICQQLSPAPVLESHVAALARKVDNYMETYVQVTWAPVLSCLYISRPLCLGRYSSPAMFESEFHKTYGAQKLLKIPDPKLRRRLRVAVVEKVISSFTKYLEYNYVSPSGITPQDLMDMLQELFEG